MLLLFMRQEAIRFMAPFLLCLPGLSLSDGHQYTVACSFSPHFCSGRLEFAMASGRLAKDSILLFGELAWTLVVVGLPPPCASGLSNSWQREKETSHTISVFKSSLSLQEAKPLYFTSNDVMN